MPIAGIVPDWLFFIVALATVFADPPSGTHADRVVPCPAKSLKSWRLPARLMLA